MIGLEHYTPTPEQNENMGKIIALDRCNKLIYKKIDNEILAYHPVCGGQGTISKKTLNQAKYSHICPFCNKQIKSTSQQTKQEYFDFVGIKMNDDEVFGYYVWVSFELGRYYFVDNEQIYYGSGSDCYHRYVGFDCFAHSLSFRPDKEAWRYTKRYKFSHTYYYDRCAYEECMFDYDGALTKTIKTKSKKEYLTQNAKFITKSNQKKLAMDNLFNADQMKFIKVFDLKNVDEVEKYNSYIKTNHIHIEDYLRHGIELNVYYLDYLFRNKIDLGKYYTFLHNLNGLGFKYEKPTDFEFRFKKVDEMYRAAKEEMTDKNIEKRYNELPKYSKDNVTISPFKNSKEIRDCGKELHNCIGGYVTKYAEKKTDIYRLDMDNALKVAIEIANGKLVQAMEDHNKKCSQKLFEHIKSFCNMNGFSLGNYA